MIWRLIFILAFISCYSTEAQIPSSVNYQAVVRDPSGQLIVDQSIGVRLSVMQGASTKYSETHIATTNSNALISIELGGGIPVSGDFSAIDWSAGSYILKSEFDLAGGTNYTITQSDQFLSLPYAFFSKTASTFITADYNDLTNLPVRDGSETKVTSGSNIVVSGTGTTGNPYTVIVSSGASYSHYVGELYQGGIIVAVWKDAGVEKGLITSLTNLGTSAWSNITATAIGASAQNPSYGQPNTDAILAQPGHTSGAAKLCDDYTNPDTGTGIYSDWYMPSVWELTLCYRASFIINTILGDVNGFSFTSIYWTSREYSATRGNILTFSAGTHTNNTKGTVNMVRAVRRF